MGWKTITGISVPLALALIAAGSSGARSTSTAGLIAFSGGAGKHPDLYVIRANGSGRRRLTRTAIDEYCPAWSPDGTKIAVTVAKGERRTWLRVITPEGQRLWQIPGWSCSGWSPDGGRILLWRSDGLYVVDADGGNSRRLAVPAEEVGSWPQWSPEGNEVAFVSAYSDDSPAEWAKRLTIIVTRVDGTDRRLIEVRPPMWCGSSSCRLYPSFFAWAPGEDIAFVLVQGDLYPERLYAIRPDGTDQRLLSGELDDIYWPTWSADGRQIAFTYRDGTTDQIWTANADGEGLRQVTRIRSRTSNLSGCFNSAWSPDARQLTCFGHAGGMYVVGTASGKPRLLVHDAFISYDFPASWQPTAGP